MVGRLSFFVQLHFWPADYCASAFADIFVQLAYTVTPSIPVCGGITLLLASFGSFTRLIVYKREPLLSCSRVRHLRQYFQSLSFRVRVYIYPLSLYISLSLVFSVCFGLIFVHKHPPSHIFLVAEVLKVFPWSFWTDLAQRSNWSTTFEECLQG